MKSIVKSSTGVMLGSLLLASAAHAHYLWIEPGEVGARLYYGEADVQLKEKSPGKLDNILAPKAFVLDAKTGKTSAATVNRTADYFALKTSKMAPAILVSEESLDVRDLTQHGLGFAKSNYYARYGHSAASMDNHASPLVLDARRRGPSAWTVQYRGQPLKDATLEVIAPNSWTQSHKTDAQGAVTINTPWRGLYVIHIVHVDKTPGKFAGKKYDALRNHFAYTFVNAEGADPELAIGSKQSGIKR